jgi:hypothetical protein
LDATILSERRKGGTLLALMEGRPTLVPRIDGRGEVWLEAVLEGGWMARMRVVAQRDRAVVAEVRVFPASWHAPGRWNVGKVPERGLTGRLLRTIPVGEAVAALAENQSWWRRHHAQVSEEVFQQFLAPQGFEETAFERSRRRDSTDYARLAAAYVAELNRGTRTPHVALAKRFYLSAARVRDLVLEARNRGLLTRPPPGRAGGSLTAKAKRMLEEGGRE